MRVDASVGLRPRAVGQPAALLCECCGCAKVPCPAPPATLHLLLDRTSWGLLLGTARRYFVQGVCRCRVPSMLTLMPGAVSRHRKVMSVYDVAPVLGEGVFVAPSASVIGDVSLGASSSVWYGAVLRGACSLLCPPVTCSGRTGQSTLAATLVLTLGGLLFFWSCGSCRRCQQHRYWG